MWNTGRFSSTLMHRVLCAAGACSLSVPRWLDQFTAPSKGTTASSGLIRLRSSSCATSSIVTNRSRDSSVEVRFRSRHFCWSDYRGACAVTATMTVTGVDMNRDGFQTCCNSLRLATALLCRMKPPWQPLPLSREQNCPCKFVWLKQFCRG